MKKLQLHAEDLRVESFETEGAAGTRGTVQGHNTLEGYECMYTHNPRALECWSYANPCQESQVPTNCTDSQPTNYHCDSCRDSITACGP